MEVFLSWSGDDSRQLALLLRSWLPQVINVVQPWMSSEDIAKGQLWSHELAERLDNTSQGIVCVTPTNMGSPWLNFESGALSKSLGNSSVRPLLLGLSSSQMLKGPLTRFQTTVAHDREDMLKLMQSLNAAGELKLADPLLATTFGNAWSAYEVGLSAIRDGQAAAAGQPGRATDDMLDEILERVRQIHRAVGPAAGIAADSDALPRIDLQP